MEIKKLEHFNAALVVIFVSIAISLFSFMTANNKITGFAVANSDGNSGSLAQFNDINSMGSLAVGRYYIDDNGIVYWLGDNSRPAVGKVNYIDESQKNREIYIDHDGNIGYLLS